MNIKLQTNEQLSVTAANGLAGVFVNGVSLSAYLSSIDTGNKVFIDDRISGIVEQTDLSIVHLSSTDYAQLCADGQLLSNALYIVEGSYTDNYGKQIKNVADPTLRNDAATKGYVDDAVSSIHIPTDLSAFTNSPGYLISNDVKISYSNQTIWLSSKSYVTSVDCADFIKDGMLSTVELCGTQLVLKFNTEASSAPISVELSNFVDNYDSKIETLSDAIDKKIFIQNSISSISGYSDLSIIKLSADEYAQMLEDGACLSNAIYIVEAPNIDAFGQRITNVASPTDLSDAANKEYVDQQISEIAVPTDLSAFTNSPGYIVSNDISNVYKKSETSSAVEISSTLSNYLDKRIGGEISGSLEVLSGNFIQTNDLDKVLVYSKSPSFMQAQTMSGFRNPSNGSMGFIILGLSGNQVKLSSSNSGDDLSDLTAYGTGDSSPLWSASLPGGLLPQRFKVLSLDKTTQIATLDNDFTDIYNIGLTNEKRWLQLSSESEAYFISLVGSGVNNAFYCNSIISAGNMPVNIGITHNEGLANAAVQPWTHAEGADNIAEGRYAHVEGYQNKALGVGAHAEGIQTTAEGPQCHAEGTKTIAAYGYAAHAEGSQTSALVRGAHAEGALTYVSGKYGHAEGQQTNAFGDCAHAEGYQTSAVGKYGHAEGYQTYVDVNQNYACHAEGYQTSSTYRGAHSEGYQTSAYGIGTHAEGYQTSAVGFRAHAEGHYTYASRQSHSAGSFSKAKDYKSWCWNGDDSTYGSLDNMYESHGQGTFNVNPINDLSGFYIGNSNLHEIISNAVSQKSTVSFNRITTSGTNIGSITIDGTTTQIYAPAGGGSNVQVSADYSTGTRVATISVDNVPTSIYVPNSSGGSNRYALETAQLIADSGSLTCAVNDQAITTIQVSSSAIPVVVQLPAQPTDGARDFILRIEISSSAAPTFTFNGINETIDFDSEDAEWAVLEPGLNIVSFTETKRGSSTNFGGSTPTYCTVTFDIENGTNAYAWSPDFVNPSDATRQVEVGQPIGALPELDENAMGGFIYWGTTSSTSTAEQVTSSTIITSDVIFYALFTRSSG